MTHDLPHLPTGWAITSVEVTETTTYRVHVAHPQGATEDDIAAAGYDDYARETAPETVFPHEVGADRIVVRGRDQDPQGWPGWAAERPDHDAVTAILEVATADRQQAA